MKKTMKKNVSLFLLFVVGMLAHAYGQGQNFTVTGNIKRLDTKLLRIYINDAKAPYGRRTDSIPVVDGKFSYTSTIEEPAFVIIGHGIKRASKRINGGAIPTPSSSMSFFAYPGAKVHFTGEISDFANAYPSGDVTNDELASLNKVIYPMMSEAAFTEVKISNGEVTDTEAKKALYANSAKLSREVLEIKKKFIETHPTSVVSAWLLEDMMMRIQLDNETAIAFFNKMDRDKLKNLPFYKSLEKRVSGIFATKIGAIVPEVSSSNTLDGAKFELSSLRGKYVIIDFWGTWCVPCIKGMPKLKEYLDKYKGKLEVLGIAKESDDGTKWRAMIKDKALNWHHVLENKDKKYVNGFNIAGFPTKFLIGKDGKILARSVGEEEGFYTKIDELLK